jgi:small subunit ribosomal protein S1
MPDIEKSRTALPVSTQPIPMGETPEESEVDAPLDADAYERLLDMYDVSFKNLAEGEVVHGIVLQINDSGVVVDVGYKSEGIINADEFRDATGQLTVKVGETVDVLLEKSEDKEGYVVLSKEKAEKMKIWDDVERAYQERRVVTGRVIERVKGGLAVDIGVRAFLPGSQVDLRPVRNLDSLRGQELRMRVIKVNKKRGNIVLSRKAVLEEENAGRKRETLEGLEDGKVMQGVVKNITEYGAFVDLGGLDGLLHITDMSWGRINHPSEVVTVGDEIQVQILKFDVESERVSLGLKQLKDDPWTTATEKYPTEMKVKGKVVSLTDYGAFVELEQGVEGLIHVSEMSWSKKVKHPSKILVVGQEVECQVLGIDQEAHRISLGLKQIEDNPWDQLGDKYPPGTKITGQVRNLTEFGAFVEVEDGIDGLIHISDLSWTKRVKHPSEVVKKGDSVEAVVLNIDAENQRLSLGLKQLAADAWEDFFRSHKAGDVVDGRVVRHTSFGLFVEVGEGIEGLVHISEFEDSTTNPEEDFKVGEVYPMRVLKMNEIEKKIGLSIKAVNDGDVQREVENYGESAGSSSTTLGDALRAAQEQARERSE